MGVPRFILELSFALTTQANVKFFRFDQRLHRIVAVPLSDLERRNRELTDGKPVRRSSSRLHSESSSPRSRRRSTAFEQTRVSLRASGSSLRDAVRQAVATGKNLLLLIKDCVSFRRTCLSKNWSPDDVVCLFGLWVSTNTEENQREVSLRARQSQAAIARFMHDIIPIVQPQFVNRDPSSHVSTLLQALTDSDALLANSNNTKSDIEHFALEHALKIPNISVIRMASSVHTVTPVPPSSLKEGCDFVLCVGTIEIRKNHHLLLDVWEMFQNESSNNAVPHLVIAGSSGWINTETMSRLRHTRGLGEVVHFVESPSDSELAWMYRNCRFTVYPSLYEGWGYPITESLNAGKVCITSNVSSMPEAAKGLCPLLDPRDREAWKRVINHLFGDSEALFALEETLRREHVITTAADTAHDVWNVLRTLTRPDQQIAGSA